MNTYEISSTDERLIRDDLDQRVVGAMEAAGLDLSDGVVSLSINTDVLIRMVQDIARAEAIGAYREFGHTIQEMLA